MNVFARSLLLLVPAVVFLSACSSLKCDAYGAGPNIYSYGPEKTYSRALAARGNRIWIGNSDGHVYRLNLRTGRSRRLTSQGLPELRDIAVRGRKVIAMQSADTSRMTLIRGKRQLIFSVSSHPVFLDGMDLLPSGKGFLMGDPSGGKFSLYTTSDAGRSWNELLNTVRADQGEAGFAASGSNVQCISDSVFCFVSGGMRSHFFRTADGGASWSCTDLPFDRSAVSGAFSVHFTSENDGVIVGGDYTRPEKREGSCLYTRDGGLTWHPSEIPPSGYRSCVIAMAGSLFACGTNGIDRSEDGGVTWGRFAYGNYMAMTVAKGKLYASMHDGKLIEF